MHFKPQVATYFLVNICLSQNHNKIWHSWSSLLGDSRELNRTEVHLRLCGDKRGIALVRPTPASYRVPSLTQNKPRALKKSPSYFSHWNQSTMRIWVRGRKQTAGNGCACGHKSQNINLAASHSQIIFQKRNNWQFWSIVQNNPFLLL